MIYIESTYVPQVLLLGNGLNRTYGGNSWGKLLSVICEDEDLKEKTLYCPYPLQAILVTRDHVKTAIKNHKDEFYGQVNLSLSFQLHRLLEAGFDDILTTNYSYELESSAVGKNSTSDYILKKYSKNIIEGKNVESKYLISSCQMIKFKDVNNRIWHIHGEARKPNSMILGHYYYASLLHKMMEFLTNRKNDYQIKQKDNKPQSIKSWLDSFILGDVYILGFGMDFCEIDLWWLINRKKRENAKVGKIYFYTPIEKEFDEKLELLKLMGVEIISFNCEIDISNSDLKDIQYDVFYQKAISNIIKKVQGKNK